MSEPPSDPIPSELSQAFYEAALLCHDGLWSPAHPEYPTVRVKAKAYTIREVCRLVTGFSDDLPNEVVGILVRSLGRDVHSDLIEKLGKDRSYVRGADCLLKLMDRREEEYRQIEDLRNR
jgi:hypothetical protein